MKSAARDELGMQAIDTIMRVSHRLRAEAERRPLTMAECAVMAFDLKLRDAGWNWGPDGLSLPVGRVATLPQNPSELTDVTKPGWKLHRCADGEQCRAEIGGGCASGWCGHFEVRPDDAGVPRFPAGT